MDTEKIERMPKLFILGTIAVVFFGAGLFYSMTGHAAERRSRVKSGTGKRTVIVYPKKSEVDFEGMAISGEVRNPGEFYFQRRQEEKFDSLVKRRKNFQREMLRDVVMTK